MNMNMLNLQALLGQAKANGAKDPLSQLADALVIDPKLLEKGEGEFSQLLANLSEGEKEALVQQITQTQENLTKVDLTENVQQAIAKTASKPTEIEAILNSANNQKVLAIGGKEERVLPTDTIADAKLTNLQTKKKEINNAERKSLFDITSKLPQTTKTNQTQGINKNVARPQLMDAGGEVELRNFAHKSPFHVGYSEAKKAFVAENRKSLFAVPKDQAPKIAMTAQDIKSHENSQVLKNMMNQVNPKNSSPEGLTKLNTVNDILNVQDPMSANLEPEQLTTTTMMEANNSSQKNQSNLGSQVKVMNFESINTTSPDQLISKIQDYIMQAKVGNEPEVQLNVEHKELGRLDILVRKINQDMVSVKIATHSNEGTQFFQQQQSNLLHTLAQSGVQVSEFKLDSSSSNMNNGQSMDQNMANSEGQKGQSSSQNQRRQDSERREHLWKMMEDRYKEAA
jgi:hypothetical protein